MFLFLSLRDDNCTGVGSRVPTKPLFFVLCWVFVDLMMGVCWLHVGSMLGCVGPILGPVGALGLCWAHVGPMLGHVEARFGDLADFRLWKNRGV